MCNEPYLCGVIHRLVGSLIRHHSRWENSGRVPSLRSRSIARAVESSVYRLGAVLRERACELRERPAATALSLPDMPTCHALAQVTTLMRNIRRRDNPDIYSHCLN